MKYLSELCDRYVNLERIKYSKGAKEFEVAVSDLSGGEPRRGSLDMFVGEDILGCQVGKRRGVMTRLDKHKAMLHKHIISIEKTSVSRKTADLDIIVGNVNVGVVNKGVGVESAIVRMEHESFESIGYRGSVIIQQSDYAHGDYALCMYDMLADLCKRSGFNLMQYERVMISSRWKRTAFIITFANTREASIYFTKMFMDVVR